MNFNVQNERIFQLGGHVPKVPPQPTGLIANSVRVHSHVTYAILLLATLIALIFDLDRLTIYVIQNFEVI